MVKDTLGRPLKDLRISVIDNCNFRCTYCMPADNHYKFLEKSEWLTISELKTLAQAFMGAGVHKFRITGGEPLLRQDLPELIAELNSLNIDDLSLTTNGYMLKPIAKKLQEAGLKRLTISLDSVDKATFAKMAGGLYKAERVLEAIEHASTIGFQSIKINCVVQRGVNDQQIEDLMLWCFKRNLIPRFIEFMDVGNQNQWMVKEVVTSKEIITRLKQKYKVEPLDKNYYGEVASRYLVDDKWEMGFISSISQPFCRTCTRARLSTDGKLYTCLFSGVGTDLKAWLKEGLSISELTKRINLLWGKRDDRYSEIRASGQAKKDKKIEMFQIGG